VHNYFDNTVTDPKTPYHAYAMLNLAICNAEFGCFSEAVTSILQCVTTARENRDTECLNYALNWLYHFTQQHPQYVKDIEAANTLGDGKEGLAYLRVRAKDVGMWVLSAAALLGEAKLCLQNGESVATAFAKIVRCSQLILTHDLGTMLGALCSVTLALWDRLGLPALSNADCHHFLHWSRDDAIVEDEIRVVCRIAAHLAAQGRYSAALSTMESSADPKALRTYRVRTYWTKMRAILHATRELHRNNLDSAAQTVHQLLQEKTDDHLEPDLVFLVDNLHIDLLIRRNDLAAAFSEVQSLMAKNTSEDIAVRIKLMLLRAHIHIRAGRPQKALTLSVRAASMARRTLLVSVLWQAIGTLSDVLISLGEFAAAEDLLLAVIPRALETDVARLAGTLYMSLADARMGLAGSEAAGSEKRKDLMLGAHRALVRADEMWCALEEVVLRREGWAKCAHIMRVIGDVERSDDYARRYVDARREIKSTTKVVLRS
jgi:anaphase-promoting complex subunit 5